MAKKLILGGLLGGAVLWVWGWVSWMAVPWHMMVLERFTDEDAVAAAVSANIHGKGIYVYPGHDPSGDEAAMMEKMERGPIFFAAVDDQGFTGMGKPMAVGFLLQVLAALLVTWVVLKTHGLTYWGKVCFVAVLALTAGVVSHLSYWNWMGFGTSYTLVMVADLVVSGVLAGLVIAKVAK
jgi:hypothetical protein